MKTTFSHEAQQRHRAAGCLLAATWLLATLWLPVASAEPPPAGTLIRSGAELKIDWPAERTREAVKTELQNLAAQHAAKAEVLQGLQAAHDGTPASAIRIGSCDLSLSRDQARSLTLLAASVEEHRFAVWKWTTNNRQRLARTNGQVAERTRDIEGLADRLARGVGSGGQPLTPEQLAAEKAVLAEMLHFREDLQGYAERSQNDVAFCEAELKALAQLEAHIDALSDKASTHVKRVMEALEQERGALVALDLRESQAQLRSLLDGLRSLRPASPPTKSTPEQAVEIHGVPLGDSLPKTAAAGQLTAADEARVAAELAKAASRIQAGK